MAMTSEHLAQLARKVLEDTKALDIVVIDVREKTSITDFIIIATGTSSRHVRAAVEQVIERVKKAKVPVLGVEGKEVGEWALVDCVDVVVHVMQGATRRFYGLEQLWQTEAEVAQGQNR